MIGSGEAMTTLLLTHLGLHLLSFPGFLGFLGGLQRDRGDGLSAAAIGAVLGAVHGASTPTDGDGVSLFAATAMALVAATAAMAAGGALRRLGGGLPDDSPAHSWAASLAFVLPWAFAFWQRSGAG
jgi:hypothetical protein